MKYKLIVIHFGEIWLKGGNRKRFITKLEDNIKTALSTESYESLENDRDRLVLHLREKSNLERISGRLSKVFGISWFGPVLKTKTEMKGIIKAAERLAGKAVVRIEAHRSDKEVEFTSHDLVGELLKESKRRKIKMEKDSERVIMINIKKDFSYLCIDKTEGAKGLPVGSSGKAVVLLSGGIDSPVASYYAMKRGLELVYLHVHGFESGEARQLSKIRDSVMVLSKHSGPSKMVLLPYHIFQGCSLGSKRYELVLFKRFLYRIAEMVAESEQADCIVTGESLGQVASQTIKNLSASSSGISTFIFRPLIGMDKQEIVNMAKRIGTFEISSRPYKDVCSITAQRTELNAAAKELDRIYAKLGIEGAAEATLKRLKEVQVKPH